MSLPRRVKLLATRAAVTACDSTRRLSVWDAHMILSAFADLRVRGPEVSRVCFRACVAFASASPPPTTTGTSLSSSSSSNRRDILTPEMLTEALVALASLQARNIPIIPRRLHPRLKELPFSCSFKTVQRAAFASMKLGKDNVDPAAIEHVARLCLESLRVGNDDVLLLALCGLLPLLPRVQACMSRRPSEMDIRRAFHDNQLHDLAELVTADDGGIVLSTETALKNPLLLLGFVVSAVRIRGLASSASGNGVLQLLQLLPMCAWFHSCYSSSSGSTQQQHVGSTEQISPLSIVRDIHQNIVHLTKNMVITRCVNGGFATFMQDNLPFFTELPRHHGVPFLQRLLAASADKTFAKAFNSYDVSKLCHACRHARWDGLWDTPTTASSSSSATTTVGDLVVQTSERLTQDVMFFGKIQQTRRDLESSQQHSGGALDGFAVCALLRMLHALALGLFAHHGYVGVRHSKHFECVMAAIGRTVEIGCSPVSMERWSLTSLLYTIRSLNDIVKLTKSLPTTSSPRPSSSSNELGASVECSLEVRVNRAVGHMVLQAASLYHVSQATVIDSLQLLYSVLSLIDTSSSESQLATCRHLCRAVLTARWTEDIAVSWEAVAATDELLLLKLLATLFTMPPQRLNYLLQNDDAAVGDHASSSTVLVERVQSMMLSYLAHVKNTLLTAPVSSDSTHAVVSALCTILPWCYQSRNKEDQLAPMTSMSSTFDSRALTTQATSVARHLFQSLIAPMSHAPADATTSALCHTLYSSDLLRLLEVLADHSTGVLRESALMKPVLKDDIQRLWHQQCGTFLAAPDHRGNAMATNDASSSSSSRGSGAATSMVQLCHALECMKKLGFVLCPLQSLDASERKSLQANLLQRGISTTGMDEPRPRRTSSSRSPSSSLSSADMKQKEVQQRFVIGVPLISNIFFGEPHIHTSSDTLFPNNNNNMRRWTGHDVAHLALIIVDQHARFSPQQWSVWSRMISSALLATASNMDVPAVMWTLKCLKTLSLSMSLLPTTDSVVVVLDRCVQLLSPSGASSLGRRSKPGEPAALVEAVVLSPLLHRLDLEHPSRQAFVSAASDVLRRVPRDKRGDMTKLLGVLLED